MKNRIGKFKLDNSKTTMKYGSLYKTKITLPFARILMKRRTLRVWLPESYDGVKSFPCLYMSDGQNIVNKYTTAFGDWNLSEIVHQIKEKYNQEIIIVGLDCPKKEIERIKEYSPSSDYIDDVTNIKKEIKNYGDDTASFIVNVIKPLIDNTFKTKKEKQYTGFLGSSMGGIFSFHICTKFPKIFGFCGAFSPAFHIFRDEFNDQYLKSINKNELMDTKFYLYCGNKGYENKYPKPTKMLFDYLKKFVDKDNVILDIDELGEHNELTWHKHSLPALIYMLDIKI